MPSTPATDADAEARSLQGDVLALEGDDDTEGHGARATHFTDADDEDTAGHGPKF